MHRWCIENWRGQEFPTLDAYRMAYLMLHRANTEFLEGSYIGGQNVKISEAL